MSLVISKDGKQIGPYSLDQARALVLSGKLDLLKTTLAHFNATLSRDADFPA